MLKNSLFSLLLSVSALSTSCTLTMQYNQCSEDSQCQNADGTQGFCSTDQLCLPNTPLERLCTTTIPDSPSPNAVHMGALLDLTDKNGRAAEAHRLIALKLGVRQINELVQLDGSRPIALDVCNVGTSAIDADNATKILIEQRNVVAIIGPNTASAATNMIARIKAAGVPTISPAIMDSGIADAASQGLFYRLAPVEREQGLQLVRELVTLSGGKSTSQLGLLSVTDSYGENIRRKFTPEWQRRDPINNKTDRFFSYRDNDANLLSVTTKTLLDAKPSFVVLIPGANSQQVIAGFSALPFDPRNPGSFESTTQLLVSSSGRTGELIGMARTGDDTMKNHLSRITGVAPLSFIDAQEGADFKTSFVATNPGLPLEQDFMVGYTYDALFVLGAASATFKGASRPDQILSVLRRLNGNANSLSLTPRLFNETVQKLAQQPNDPFTLLGVTGAIRFQTDGSRDPVLLERWKIDIVNGVYVNTPANM
jgi:hypothetical protein